MDKKRDISLDCLRILCMLMVVCLHTSTHGGINDALAPGTINWVCGNILFASCYVAVNCFVLISGYFLCKAQFKLKKLVSIWIQALFYSNFYYLLISIATDTFSIKEFIKCALVFTMKQYWFVTAYLLLYMVSPFLNCALQAMSQKKHFLCCIVLLTVFSGLHNLIYICDFGGISGGYSFLWFCVLYVLASYIRFYGAGSVRGSKKWCFLYFSAILVVAGERLFAYYITPHILGRVALTSLFYSYNAIPMVVASFCLFQCFRSIEIENRLLCKWIGRLAPLAFGVYLIHDNRMVRSVLWDALHLADYTDSTWLLLYIFVCTCAIFGICCAIEWIRQVCFAETGFATTIAKICDNIQMKFSQWLDKVIIECEK